MHQNMHSFTISEIDQWLCYLMLKMQISVLLFRTTPPFLWIKYVIARIASSVNSFRLLLNIEFLRFALFASVSLVSG